MGGSGCRANAGGAWEPVAAHASAWRVPGVGLFVALAAGAVAQAQPASLHEEALAVMTAASATLPVREAATEGPGPARPEVETAPRTPRSTIVVDASLAVEAEDRVHVGDGAQAGLHGTNTVNAANADVAQGLNVLERKATRERTGRVTTVEQSNRISQINETREGAVRYHSLGGSLSASSGASHAASQSETLAQRTEIIDRHVTSRSTTTTFSATVEPERLGLFDDPVTIAGGQSLALPAFTLRLPDVRVRFSIGEPDNFFNVDVDQTLSIPALTVPGANLELGSVRLHGDDIVLTGASLNVPELPDFDVCFRSDGCSSNQYVSVSIPGFTVNLGQHRVEGGNPLGGLGLDLGYAVAGDGSITIDAGSYEVSGEITLAPILEASLDVDVPGFGVVHTFRADVPLPSFGVPIHVDEELPVPDGFNRTFAGEACAFGAGQRGCAPLDVSMRETVHTEQGRTDRTDRTAASAETYLAYHVSTATAEVRVRTGQAELVALQGAAVDGRSYSVVIVDGGAQRGAAALNAVNASAAVIGNAVNVGAERTNAAVGTGGVANSSLSQTNAISQIGRR